MRSAECGVRNVECGIQDQTHAIFIFLFHSAFRTPHSTLLLASPCGKFPPARKAVQGSISPHASIAHHRGEILRVGVFPPPSGSSTTPATTGFLHAAPPPGWPSAENAAPDSPDTQRTPKRISPKSISVPDTAAGGLAAPDHRQPNPPSTPYSAGESPALACRKAIGTAHSAAHLGKNSRPSTPHAAESRNCHTARKSPATMDMVTSALSCRDAGQECERAEDNFTHHGAASNF